LLQQEQSRRGRRRVNPAVKRILELQIQTLLQNAPRDPDKLERPLQVKGRRHKEEAIEIEDTERLVTKEIEKLCVVLQLVRSRIISSSV